MTYFPMLFQENPSQIFLCVCKKGNFIIMYKVFRGGKVSLAPLRQWKHFMIFEKRRISR